MFQKQLNIPFSARRRPCEEPGFAYKVYEIFCMQRCLLQRKRRETSTQNVQTMENGVILNVI